MECFREMFSRKFSGKFSGNFVVTESFCERKFLSGRSRRKGMAMIISMKRHATREEIDAVTRQVNHFGYKVHSIEGEERVVIGVVGVGDVTACMESIEAMPQVENVMRISAPGLFSTSNEITCSITPPPVAAGPAPSH